MLAPPVAALAAAGGPRGAAPVTRVAGVCCRRRAHHRLSKAYPRDSRVARRYPGSRRRPALVVLALVAAGFNQRWRPAASGVGAVVGASARGAPAAWTAVTMWEGATPRCPRLGRRRRPGSAAPPWRGSIDAALLPTLRANHGDAAYLLPLRLDERGPIIIRPASGMAIGGFSAATRLTANELAAWSPGRIASSCWARPGLQGARQLGHTNLLVRSRRTWRYRREPSTGQRPAESARRDLGMARIVRLRAAR